MLELLDDEVEHLFSLNEEKLRFIQLYLSMNSKNENMNFKKIDNNLDSNIASIVVELIKDGYKKNKNSKYGDIIFEITKSNGIKQAEYASEVVKKCLKGNIKFPKNIDEIISYICQTTNEFQAEYTSKFLLTWNMGYDDVDCIQYYSRMISESNGIEQAKSAYKYAIEHKTDTYGKRLINCLSNANGIVQTRCVVKMIEEWDKWNSTKQMMRCEFINYITNVSSAKGDIQALRAMELYMMDDVCSVKEIRNSVKFIADVKYAYQAGYASLVLKNSQKYFHNKAFLINKLIRIVTSAKGPEQAEYASYLSVDKKILEYSYSDEVVEMVARAVGELQTEIAYLVIKKTDLLSKYNGLLILEAIVKMANEKECIRIRKDIVNYIEKLPNDVCLQLLEENYFKKDESTFDLWYLMQMDDLNIIIDIVTSIDEDYIEENSKVTTRKLIKSIDNK